MKVLNHDTAGGYFKDLDQARSHNSDDPDAPLYSILDQVENFRMDGVFHIRICYKELSQDFPCNEWNNDQILWKNLKLLTLRRLK